MLLRARDWRNNPQLRAFQALSWSGRIEHLGNDIPLISCVLPQTEQQARVVWPLRCQIVLALVFHNLLGIYSLLQASLVELSRYLSTNN